jgi:hypothetical protein
MNGFTHFSEKVSRKKLVSEPNVFGGRRVKNHNTSGKILKTRKKRTHLENPQRNPWQILVTEVEAILQPSPNARTWCFVTFATSQQAMDAKVIVLHLPCKMLGCCQQT